MRRNVSKYILFDTKTINRLEYQYKARPTWQWSISAELIMGPHWQKEKEKLEQIYSNYPNCSHKKQIKKDFFSSNKDLSWGAWAELRTYDWLTTKGIELIPEPLLGSGKPDFFDNTFNQYIEVTAIRAESDIKRREENKIKKLLTKLNEVAITSEYNYHVTIPISNFPLPSKIDYGSFQNSFTKKLNAIQNPMNKNPITCNISGVRVIIIPVNKPPKTSGQIIDYSFDFKGAEKEFEQFAKRTYDTLLKKITKYDALDRLNTPYIIVLFIKGRFLAIKFIQALRNIIDLKERAGVTCINRVSGILLCETAVHPANITTLVFDRNYLYFPYPSGKCPVNNAFLHLINAKTIKIRNN